jgi:hypothetical protein
MKIYSPTFGLFTGPPATDAMYFGATGAQFEPFDAAVSRFVFGPNDSSVERFVGFTAAV